MFGFITYITYRTYLCVICVYAMQSTQRASDTMPDYSVRASMAGRLVEMSERVYRRYPISAELKTDLSPSFAAGTDRPKTV